MKCIYVNIDFNKKKKKIFTMSLSSLFDHLQDCVTVAVQYILHIGLEFYVEYNYVLKNLIKKDRSTTNKKIYYNILFSLL